MALEADTVVILSSELIAKITQEYFNKTMFKQKVEVVDLEARPNGYAFSIAFVEKESKGVAQENAPIEMPPAWNEVEADELLGEELNQRYAVKTMFPASFVPAPPARASNGRLDKTKG